MSQGLPDTLGWSEQGASQVSQIIVLGMQVSIWRRVSLRIHPTPTISSFTEPVPFPLERDPSSFLGTPEAAPRDKDLG